VHQATLEFETIFKKKSGNNWWTVGSDKSAFGPKKGKYIMVDVDYSYMDEPDTKSSTDVPVTKLHQSVFDLISMISNKDLMRASMSEYDIDTKKMPLGKLTKKQIKDGYTVLQKIQKAIEDKDKTDAEVEDVEDLSSQFYSLIPHNFGKKKPPAIDTLDLIKQKTDMLESLSNLEIASKLLKKHSATSNPVDDAYNSLKCELVPVDPTSEEYSLVQKYMKNTHGPTHSSYNLEIAQLFKVDRQGEKQRFESSSYKQNKRLLFHGSRTMNFMGILSQGLRIAPPEAPSTGYMFGKGIYLADSVSKAANYCSGFSGDKVSEGLILLSEASLGKSREYRDSCFVTDLPDNDHHSTKGVGTYYPDPEEAVIFDGMKVPLGTLKRGSQKNLYYNEFIVYKEEQVKLRYLIRVNFVRNSY
jgi:poly [ADP-ribose] polymerase